MPETVSQEKCRIVVDAMGGDFAPLNCILGAIDAQNTLTSSEIYLVGKKDEILSILQEKNLHFPEERIIPASEVIEMGDSPTHAIKTKKDSSIVVGCNQVKNKFAHAFVSAGNTGAMMAASTFIIGRIPGVARPTIGTFMPNVKGVTTIFDVGASVDSKPSHLVEYAIMGSIFVRELYGINNPSIGLLSVGEEDSKGNEVTLAALQELRKMNLNFKGNVEGRDIFKGTVNVVVCDGFIGNIVLKFAESIPRLLKHLLGVQAKKSLFDMLVIGLSKGALKRALTSTDYQEYGGTPLLGANGISIIGHGSSSPKAIKNMVIRAYEMHEKNIVEKIGVSIKEFASVK